MCITSWDTNNTGHLIMNPASQHLLSSDSHIIYWSMAPPAEVIWQIPLYLIHIVLNKTTVNVILIVVGEKKQKYPTWKNLIDWNNVFWILVEPKILFPLLRLYSSTVGYFCCNIYFPLKFLIFCKKRKKKSSRAHTAYPVITHSLCSK